MRLLVFLILLAFTGATVKFIDDFQEGLRVPRIERLTPTGDAKQEYRITDVATHRIFTVTSP